MKITRTEKGFTLKFGKSPAEIWAKETIEKYGIPAGTQTMVEEQLQVGESIFIDCTTSYQRSSRNENGKEHK